MTTLTVTAAITAPIQEVWNYWNSPEHITKWNQASPDWHTPFAENDLRPGGKLKSRMEAKDGSMGFDFEGTYTVVIPNERIEYKLGDGRKVVVEFSVQDNHTIVTEHFDAEDMHPHEFQQAGWQAILNSFKNYVESFL